MGDSMTRRQALKTTIAAGVAGSAAAVGGVMPRSARARRQEGEDGEVRIGTYASRGPLLHSTNTHWIETAEGVIVVDGQWVLSEAERALLSIEATGKPILGIFITHPHSDHVGGIGVFTEAAGPEVPIFAAQLTHDYLRDDTQGFFARRREQFGDDFPAEITLPNTIVRDGEEIQLGGVAIKLIDLPENEAATTTMLYLPDEQALIAGDLVGTETTPIAAEGHVENWIAQLQSLAEDYPDLGTIYPGHGEPAPAGDVIEAELDYLVTFRDLVAEGLTQYTFDKRRREIIAAGRTAIVAAIEERYPNHHSAAGFTARRELLENNVDWLARELTADDR